MTDQLSKQDKIIKLDNGNEPEDVQAITEIEAFYVYLNYVPKSNYLQGSKGDVVGIKRKMSLFKNKETLKQKFPELQCRTCSKHITEIEQEKLYHAPTQLPRLIPQQDDIFYCKTHFQQKRVAKKL